MAANWEVHDQFKLGAGCTTICMVLMGWNVWDERPIGLSWQMPCFCYECWKKGGGGKKTHFVLDADAPIRCVFRTQTCQNDGILILPLFGDAFSCQREMCHWQIQ